MRLKCVFSGFCGRIVGLWFSAYKALFDLDISLLFQIPKMCGQIAICHVQELFEGVEIHLFIDHQDGHDTQSYDVFESLIVIPLHAYRSYL